MVLKQTVHFIKNIDDMMMKYKDPLGKITILSKSHVEDRDEEGIFFPNMVRYIIDVSIILLSAGSWLSPLFVME